MIPACGADPIIPDSAGLSCAMQLYHAAEAGLAVLQVRSGLLPASSGALCEDLVSWARSQGVSRLVSLTSSLAHERQESQLRGPSCRVLATEGVSVPDNFVRLEPRMSLHGMPVDNHQEVIIIFFSLVGGSDLSTVVDYLVINCYLSSFTSPEAG